MTVQNQVVRNLLYWTTRNKWLLVAGLVCLILLCLHPPAGLNVAGWRTIIIAITALILIVSEPIPLPGIAFIIVVLQVYFGIAEANMVAKAFMNDAVFFIMGSLMLAVAIVKQGWDARIALGIIKITGNKTHQIAFGFSVLSAVLSSFIGSHTVAAVMLPIGLTLIRYTSQDQQKVKKLASLILFSIAYGSLIGSIGTPSGGGRNAIILVYWKEYGLSSLSYWEWMKYAYPLVFLQLPFLSWILRKNFVPEYIQMDSSIRRLKVQVAKAGKITGKQLLAAFIFMLILAGWIFYSEQYGLGMISVTGVVLYLIVGIVKWEDFDRHVNWGVVILFGAAISLGVQIKNTGAAAWIAENIIQISGSLIPRFPIIVDGINVLLTTIMANVLSSTATVAVLAPITINLPGNMIHSGMLTAIASAFGYLTAFAAPPCVIIYSSGLVRSKDFLKAGWKMGLISVVAVLIFSNLFW
ncbi:MAG: SLC13 family permease [Fidelibacterota bacterium]